MGKFLKFVFYLLFFYTIGYFYAIFTEGTVFDNFIVMLISLIILLFIIEGFISYFKKKIAAVQSELEVQENESFNEIVENLMTEFQKTWNIPYNDHLIKVVNHANKEELYIDDKLVAEKKRKGWFSWIVTYQSLTAVLEENGENQPVKVKLGGLVSLKCKVYVDNKLIFKDTVKYNLFTGEVKEKD
ncbi:hypothetical protein QA612_13830 [Evansella sp. AB-P1]|uniref:hypothetical protein n=1 Tax=Evansella sp. AB-P1 TaxID=3037653 RepID=UPI00241E5654|nr:hypothetical protein [Evansella sp. AB-P1]MDG5788561.1 hypothetical protein [Evansella sp. AB-P1]